MKKFDITTLKDMLKECFPYNIIDTAYSNENEYCHNLTDQLNVRISNLVEEDDNITPCSITLRTREDNSHEFEPVETIENMYTFTECMDYVMAVAKKYTVKALFFS